MILRNQDKQRLLTIAKRTLPTSVAVWAYGSRVNGDAHDTSDLDLVLRSQDLSPIDYGAFYDFTEALEESTIPIIIQVFDWARMPESFHHNILAAYEVLREAGEE